jgi:hypothetical protein
MEDNSIFISSCSRRQLARRRSGGTSGRGRRNGFVAGMTMPVTVLGLPLVLLALVLVAALVTALAVGGRF